MTRVNLLLALALLVSALYLVRTAYEARRLYAELDKARSEQQRLDVDYKRLEADAQSQATSVRVDKSARGLPSEVMVMNGTEKLKSLFL